MHVGSGVVLVGLVRLEVVEFEGPGRWRFVLSDEAGGFLADHQVDLDLGLMESDGFVDLHGFVRWRADPGDRLADEARLVELVGRWIGVEVLGRVGEVLAEVAPVVVELRLPAGAEVLATRPFELGYVDGVPLARQDVCFVVCSAGSRVRAKEPVEDALRVLGVFSLPSGGSALALRRERFELARSLREIGQVHDRRVEFKAVQYGVTRTNLRDVLMVQGPWDVVHFSGHGLRGGLVLEHDDGSPDVIDTGELVGLLRPARGRLKLVTLSSCYSAAATAAATLQVLGVDIDVERGGVGEDGRGLPAVAEELADGLGCAVLAMRYPVVDDFAVDLAQGLYELMVAGGQALGRALQLALPDAAKEPATPGAPPTSIATPGLFGAMAADLRLVAPAGAVRGFEGSRVRLAGFPDQPPRFVGRLEVMTRASAALAPGSGQSGVLFHGMAGAGKTTCAVEAAYNHEDAFPVLVWWQAPTEPDADIAGALTGFALALENKIDNLQWVHLLDNRESLAAFLPRLTQFMEQTRVLTVIDNAETLLSDSGQWRDPRWAPVIDALCGQGGLGRVIITSRRRPAGLDGRMVIEGVHALSRDEAVLLARQLPHLGALIDGTAPGIGIEDGRRLAARALAVVQGHPKLLELADGQAADPDQLRAHLDTADTAWQQRGARLEGFFATGDTAATPEDYLAVLHDWTRHTTSILPDPATLLLQVLCGIEPDDRIGHVLHGNWADIWRRLERPGDPPDLDTTLTPLTEQALTTIDTRDPEPLLHRYRIHPAIADTTRRDTPTEVTAATAAELAAYWGAIYNQALRGVLGEEDTTVPGAPEEAGQWVIQAARSLIPYLLQLEEWDEARSAIDQLIYRDKSADTLAALLPDMHRLVEATMGTPTELASKALLAKLTVRLDPTQGEPLLRDVIQQATTTGNFNVASVYATELINLLMNSGRLADALTLADQTADYTARAGLGPWTQLLDQVVRLQILNAMGRNDEVLTEFEQLRDHMDTLSTQPARNEHVTVWNVRETLLDVAQSAAGDLRRWDQAFELAQAVYSSKEDRGATDLELARTLTNSGSLLVRLERYDEARNLLVACRSVFEAEADVKGLGTVYTALADLEDELGRPQAIEFERRALRYTYLIVDIGGLAVSHNNLAGYLRDHGGDAREAVAHRLAAGLISSYAGFGHLADTLKNLAYDLARLADVTMIPDHYDEVCRLVDQTDGVQFRPLISVLTDDRPDHDQTLAELLTRATQTQPELPDWAPALIQSTVTAAHGDPDVAAELTSFLDRLAGTDDWAALAAIVGRIVNGERDRAQLLAGLDAYDTAITSAILDELDHPDPTADEESDP
jgi:tetratricopeptide (TPR) repeat protein